MLSAANRLQSGKTSRCGWRLRRFTRLTNAFSKKFENHCHALALYFFWYNWTRQHKAHRLSLAMAAGLTDKLLSMTNLAEMVDAALPKPGEAWLVALQKTASCVTERGSNGQPPPISPSIRQVLLPLYYWEWITRPLSISTEPSHSAFMAEPFKLNLPPMLSCPSRPPMGPYRCVARGPRCDVAPTPPPT